MTMLAFLLGCATGVVLMALFLMAAGVGDK